MMSPPPNGATLQVESNYCNIHNCKIKAKICIKQTIYINLQQQHYEKQLCITNTYQNKTFTKLPYARVDSFIGIKFHKGSTNL